MISKQLWNSHLLAILLKQECKLLSKIIDRTFLCCSKTLIEAIKLPIILLSSLYHSSSPRLTFYLLRLMFFQSLLEFLAFKSEVTFLSAIVLSKKPFMIKLSFFSFISIDLLYTANQPFSMTILLIFKLSAFEKLSYFFWFIQFCW